MSESSPPAPGPTLIAGRYQVIQKLGAGAFGTVFKARDTTLGRELAIKTMRLEGLAAASVDLDELRKRFKQEATAGAALKHPNIVTIYDYGESEGQNYLAMEFVEGVGLDRIIREVKRLPVDRAAAIAAQVADALGYAHKKNVIHRDIKPANIMVEAGERVKVTDFGIARVTDSAEQLTATGGILGTPSYMSPEQARGRPVDGRSDLFSVGCVLYELLSGSKAFTGDNISAIIFKIIAEEPQPIQELDPLLSDDMVRIVKKALAKEPDARYQTGQELASDLFALTRPGHVPTLRQSDVPTAAGEAPTIATPPTAQGTISSAPTAARRPAATTSPSAAGATTPAPPTELMEGGGASAPPAVSRPAAPRRPAAALPHGAPPSRTGGGAGRLVGIAAGGAALLAVGALGAWMVLGRTQPERPVPSPTPAAHLTPTPDAAPATPSPAAPAGPDAGVPVTAPVPIPEPTPTAIPTPTTRSGAPSSSSRAPGQAPRGASPPDLPPTQPVPTAPESAPPPPPADDAFLDDLPEPTAPDGRAAGQALAQAYGSGNAPAYGSSSRFRRRPRIPRDTQPAEQPAVRTLAWILSAENAHFRRTGRYATLSELIEAGDLPLTVPLAAGGFSRRGYRFAVTAAGDEFRADATPTSPRGRPFYVDDNGFVLVAE